MSSLLLLLLNCFGGIASTNAWTVTRSPSTVGQPTAAPRAVWEIVDSRRNTARRSSWFPLNLYVETTDHPTYVQVPSPSRQRTAIPHPSVTAAAHSHGMPWQSSICSDYPGKNLYFMPFWEYQLQFMQQHLTNLRGTPCTSSTGQDMSYVENSAGRQRMHTCTFTSDEYRLIRMTVMDAGSGAQVFTSVWYPHDSRLPVLGIDLLQFNHAKKHLCIVDFQPLSDAIEFVHLLDPVRAQYPSLQGVMTDRFYNAQDSYFSNSMLLGRHDAGRAAADGDNGWSADAMVFRDLFPAYQHYLRAHVGLVQEQHSYHAAESAPAAANHHAAPHCHYDQYSAERDPAHALLARAFGPDWAMDYVYDVLFPLAERPTASESQA